MYFNYLIVDLETTPNPNYLGLVEFPYPSILGLAWLLDLSHMGLTPLPDPSARPKVLGSRRSKRLGFGTPYA